MYMCYNFTSPEKALDHLLSEGEKSYRGSAHVWIVHKILGPSMKASGAKPITRKQLENRNYIVNWCNDSVSIEFTDAIFIDFITGRSYPDKVRCQVVRFPTNEAL